MNRKLLGTSLGVLLAAGSAAGALLVGTAPGAAQAPKRPAATRPAGAAQQVVARAVGLIGGEAKVRAVRTITATGYGQYAYMWGGGRIDGNPDAPEKYMAANDLSRVYDLDNDRFMIRERRNMVFPFLGRFGHSFSLNTQVLDRDVPFNIDGEKATRQADRMEGALTNDGVHLRRMWMMNNPVVLLRRMMNPATRLSAPRREGANTVVDLVLKEGDKLSAGFAPDGMPAFVRWGSWHANLGQANFTTFFSGWAAWDGQGGVLMPLGYDTRLDWRNVDYFKMYVDAYKVNAAIPDLAAPASVRNTPAFAYDPARPLSSVQLAPGIWRISNGTQVVAFKDHIVLFELGLNPIWAKQVLAYARALAPGKPIRYLVASHNHFDHTAGVRQAVAEGITLIQRPSTLQQLKEMAEHKATDYPDDLALKPQPFRSLSMGEHLRLQDETQTLDLYWGRNNGHMTDVVFGYVPSAKLIMEGDMVSAAYDWSHWPDTLRDVMAYYKLDVERVSPVHTIAQVSPDVMTLKQAEELTAGAVKRAREHCASDQEKGFYSPGCPVQSKYY